MIKHTLRAVRLVRMIWTANMTGCSWSWAVWKRPSACSLNKIRNGSITSKWNDKKKKKKPLYCHNVRTASLFLIRRLHMHSDILLFPSFFLLHLLPHLLPLTLTQIFFSFTFPSTISSTYFMRPFRLCAPFSSACSKKGNGTLFSLMFAEIFMGEKGRVQDTICVIGNFKMRFVYIIPSFLCCVRTVSDGYKMENCTCTRTHTHSAPSFFGSFSRKKTTTLVCPLKWRWIDSKSAFYLRGKAICKNAECLKNKFRKPFKGFRAHTLTHGVHDHHCVWGQRDDWNCI